ncbi:uncharacterized protein UBRO_21086 [Ustilago bromivora]|uniref:DDE Tnp4 domain-containing protein n=1 Tax=Ustilago bromivora TaxID=307758 RepID=A0A1K0HKK2_9BASI|nr:uncharacterized protein UBRO_21086 [Ustilago bromivora]
MLALFNMVCTSDKQELLGDIEMVILATLLVETKLKLELASTADTWHPNDNLDDSDDDNLDHAVSQALITTHSIINDKQYSLPYIYISQCNQTLLDMPDHYPTISHKRFRGLVHMTLKAFEALVLRLSTTVAFQHITNSCKVRQQVAVGLRMVDGLYELNQEVVTFAMEDERANASAWVVEKSGVEEWGRGWLVTDGAHIKLVWKPALHAQEHFSYQGNYSFNVSLVFLPHSLHIVESIIGHPGSSHDLHIWASGDNRIVAKPCLHLDKGEFVWVDAGFGFSAFSVGPFNNNTASKSHDIQYFNYFLSRVQVCAEHGIAYCQRLRT